LNVPTLVCHVPSLECMFPYWGALNIPTLEPHVPSQECAFPILGKTNHSYMGNPCPFMKICIPMLGNIEQFHMGITCSFMGMCVPILKNTKNTWHWECTFLRGKIKCSSRTCPFMGSMLGRLSVFSLLPHVPLMGNTKLSHWECAIPHGNMCFVIPHKNVHSYMFPNMGYVFPYLPWEFWARGAY